MRNTNSPIQIESVEDCTYHAANGDIYKVRTATERHGEPIEVKRWDPTGGWVFVFLAGGDEVADHSEAATLAHMIVGVR